jgi:glycine cleavage system H protein
MAKTEQPENLRYTETHEWVRVEGREAVIGVSDYAQDELGDVVYLELPPQEGVGSELRAGEHFGDIESVKATSELFTPVSGKITRINDGLREHPEQVNTDPYGAGWMIAIEMSDPTELDRLMDAAAYADFLEHEGH